MLMTANSGELERIVMSRRYTYDRMNPQQFREALDGIDMPRLAFARILGFEAKRVEQWASGEQDIPIWVPVFMRLLKNCPGAIPEARQAAAEMIRLDTWRPEDGEYPFLAKDLNNEH